MNDNDILGAIRFTTERILQPWNRDPEGYALRINGDIATDTEEGSEAKLGDMKMTLIKVVDAIRDEVPLSVLFDAMALDDLWEKLFVDDDFAPNLDICSPGRDVLFIDTLNVDPACQDSSIRLRAVETAISVFCPLGVTVAHFSLLGDAEWNRLGFKLLPETECVYRSVTKFPVRPPEALTVDELIEKLETIRRQSPDHGRTDVFVSINRDASIYAHDCILLSAETEAGVFSCAEITLAPDFSPQLVFMPPEREKGGA